MTKESFDWDMKHRIAVEHSGYMYFFINDDLEAPIVPFRVCNPLTLEEFSAFQHWLALSQEYQAVILEKALEKYSEG